MEVNFTIERAETPGHQKLFVLTVNDKKVFYVGELICWIIEKLTDGKSRQQIREELNERFKGQYEFTESKIDHIVDEQISKLGIFDTEKNSPHSTNSPLSNIRGKWTVTRFETIQPLLRGLQWLFRPEIYWPLLALLVTVNVYFMNYIFTHYIHVASSVQSIKQCGKGLDFLLLFYPSAILLLYLHEVGHAAASYCFKVVPKNIGAGFYLIFPVLYTELNGVWKLDRHKRTIINTAGIYVQLLLNLLLIWLVFNVTDPTGKHVVKYLIQMNIFTIFLNVNPFLKFDGYWILSDLFRMPNLRQQSNYYLLRVMNFLFPKKNFKLPPAVAASVKPWHPFLIIYSFLKYLFFAYVFYAIPMGAARSVGTLYNVVVNKMIVAGDYSVCTVETAIKTTFGLAILSYFLYRPLKSLFLVIKKSISRR